MELRIIKTEEQHRRYLQEARRLAKADPEPETSDGARLELLAKLIDDYERERFRFRRRDPIEAILFRMEEQGLRQADIAAIVGGKNRASEILSRKRPLTLSMVRALHEKLGIPSELLIREPAAEYRVRRRKGKRTRAATTSLLKILALGKRQVDEGKTVPFADVVRRLRARRPRR